MRLGSGKLLILLVIPPVPQAKGGMSQRRGELAKRDGSPCSGFLIVEAYTPDLVRRVGPRSCQNGKKHRY
jgi:hypothetical protein